MNTIKLFSTENLFIQNESTGSALEGRLQIAKYRTFSFRSIIELPEKFLERAKVIQAKENPEKARGNPELEINGTNGLFQLKPL